MKQLRTPEQCQAQAAKCEAWAREVRSDDIAGQLRDLAKEWRRLATLRAESLV